MYLSKKASLTSGFTNLQSVYFQAIFLFWLDSMAQHALAAGPSRWLLAPPARPDCFNIETQEQFVPTSDNNAQTVGNATLPLVTLFITSAVSFSLAVDAMRFQGCLLVRGEAEKQEMVRLAGGPSEVLLSSSLPCICCIGFSRRQLIESTAMRVFV
ncbi:hypothetical protein K491DRAFT_6269 [Lophiostoma macrostomum CBS 122681]|uniref:Uncharacterized protein n=1 Tax=Lophiostoma macrostomum CBS 122681 TaxID=1314788 RepID=A0A6A6TSU4_9PLEO|nr:hypothetical protein K491DRAFT_6269 [Lophiostoma macrostomum CBS 122681]